MYRAQRPLLVLTIGILAALVLVFFANPKTAEGTTYHVITGTECNDWTKGVHDGLGEPENTLCQKTDLKTGSGADKIVGKAGWDYMVSGAGDDLLTGNRGMDAYYGGPGNDTFKDSNVFPIRDDENHDHAWGGAGDDRINIADGYDEPNHIEEAHGDSPGAPDGTDECVVDNDAGDKTESCERVTVVNGDGSRIGPFTPGNVPSGVRVTVKP